MMEIDLGHINDVGSIIKLRVLDSIGQPIDLSVSTSPEIWFKKPNGAYVKEAASFTTDGSDGYVQYTFDADDLTVPGLWQAQAIINMPGGVLHSSYYKFMIEKNLEL